MPKNDAAHEITKSAQDGPTMTIANYEQAAMRTMADQSMIRTRNLSGVDKKGQPVFPECDLFLGSVKMTQMDNAARGMAGDAGEVNTCIQNVLEYGKPLDRTNLLEELGDVLWRIVQMCDAVGFTLEDVMRANVRKLAIRFPDKYSDFLADEANRNREGERQALEVVPDCSNTDPARFDGLVPQLGDPYSQTESEARKEIIEKGVEFLGYLAATACAPVPAPSPGIPKITPIDDLRQVAQKFCKKCGLKLHRNNTAELCNSCTGPAYYAKNP